MYALLFQQLKSRNPFIGEKSQNIILCVCVREREGDVLLCYVKGTWASTTSFLGFPMPSPQLAQESQCDLCECEAVHLKIISMKSWRRKLWMAETWNLHKANTRPQQDYMLQYITTVLLSSPRHKELWTLTLFFYIYIIYYIIFKLIRHPFWTMLIHPQASCMEKWVAVHTKHFTLWSQAQSSI